MRTIKSILLILLFWIFGIVCSFAQPFGPGDNPGGGGPPPPPPNFCIQFPDDPTCQGNTSVPVSSTEGTIIFLFLAGTFFMYRLYKQQGVTNE